MYRVLLLWCLCCSAWAQESLLVGWSSWHPFSFRDEQQQLQGLDIDLLKAIFNRAGFHANYSEMPWARVLRELEFGTIQLTMSANQTAERDLYARFTLPYRNEETVLIVRRQDKGRWQEITQLSDLLSRPDFTIGLLRDFDYGTDFRTFMQSPQMQQRLLVRLKMEPLIKLLLAGRIQGVVMDPMGLQQLNLAGIPLDQLTTLLDIQQTPVHLMLSRRTTTPQQLQRLDEAIRALLQSPEYGQILARYRYPLQ
ncbi:transporter substrate-binding domain-containing protein [Aeromonas hydrophila]|uniref:substrate-binding periplasmic protein n=1 Tax=Aeromonas hydrophila TaxID=644 RepID=UPI00083C9F37|nr:transporter substrate-binding domain-containing protein [Aeromonas hydrophila]MCX4041345.1 transporter substrate-binding domain-containing protein [Aeromonas hydrophila]OCY06369.1 ABC transporter substrate-binding protein [Aeromonas hydrophila]OCY09674.1 ABC transporter substrate-binding protein [Aeromonas hydrophila]HAU4875804.1 amino acid ABC transporter substrate-binding protein [Aeromonas hydrophila]HAU4920886.1 amino acid ABC transporter substrate-binding protein [Aeromonas hydrophila]